MHLILATQRPGGVVGPDIRANTNLRVALRMTDSGESTDVIDVADAARIPKSVPGRAYARLGHSSVVPFQSARVGGRWAGEEDPATGLPFVRVLDWRDFATAPPTRPSRSDSATAATDLSVLVQAMGDARDRLGIGRVHSPWLPPLPELLPLAEVASAAVGTRRAAASSEEGLRFAVGLEDLPDTRSSAPRRSTSAASPTSSSSAPPVPGGRRPSAAWRRPRRGPSRRPTCTSTRSTAGTGRSRRCSNSPTAAPSSSARRSSAPRG